MIFRDTTTDADEQAAQVAKAKKAAKAGIGTVAVGAVLVYFFLVR